MINAREVPPAVRRTAVAVWIAVAAVPLPILLAHAQNRAARPANAATIHWDQVPLRDALERLADLYGAEIFLDRRIDPSTRVRLDVQNVGAAEALAQTAAAAGVGVSQIGSLNYVGPLPATDSLRSLAALRSEEVSRLPARQQSSLTQRRPLKWPRLTEPRTLISAVVAQRGWRVTGAELVPHDLWLAGSLPEMSLAEQLTVQLTGFDLTFRVRPEQRSLEIVPIDRPVTLSRRYRLRYAELDGPRLRQQFPELQVRIDGDWATVEARLEDHQRLAAWLQGPATRQGPPGNLRSRPGATKQVFTLRVQDQSVQSVLNTLVERLMWPLAVDEEAIRAAGLSLERRVSFEVKNADQEELLDALLRPAGLDFLRDGERLRIVPRQ